MRTPSPAALLAAILITVAGPVRAQTAPAPPTTSPLPESSGLEAKDSPAATFAVSLYGYFVPDGRDYVQPTLALDLDDWHLEARYNYEELDVGSAWLGYNFEGGTSLVWGVTPMLGAVFGSTTGIAPGFEVSLGWWKFECYSEGEWVFTVDDSSDSYFYTWTELTLSPVSWFRFGLVTQRTRTYETGRDIERGVLAAITLEKLELTACLFDGEGDDPTVVIGMGLSF